VGVRRFEVFLVNLDPTVGSEIRKARPCVVVSPDEMNRYVRTVVVAPLTTAGRPYPSRVPVRFAGKNGQVVVDQLRTVDKIRLARRWARSNRARPPRSSRSCGSSSRPEGRGALQRTVPGCRRVVGGGGRSRTADGDFADVSWR